MDEDIIVDILPFIGTKIVDNDDLLQKISALSEQLSAVVFTSSNAVDAVFRQIPQRKPAWKVYCTSGPTSDKIIRRLGREVIAGPAADASVLADLIIRNGEHEIVFFCGNERRHELPQRLKQENIRVEEVVVYATQLTPHVIKKQYDAVLFFSPSAVKSFFSVNLPDRHTPFFAIGATTSASIRQYAENKIIVAESPSKEKLVETAIAYCRAAAHHE